VFENPRGLRRDRRYDDGRLVPQKFRYVVQKGEWDPVQGGDGRCGTDVHVRRENWHGTRLVRMKRLFPFPDWCPQGQHGDGGAGCWRLRVYMGGASAEYLHKAAAFAWGYVPQRAGDAGEWAEFKAAYEGDHLPFLDRDGRLATRPEWVVAGWIEATDPAKHRRRDAQLRQARAVEAAALARLRRAAPLLRTLQSLRLPRKVADLALPAKAAHLREDVERGRQLSWTSGDGRGTEVGAWAHDDDPCLEVLIVEPPGERPMTVWQSLIALCMHLK